MLWLLCQHQSSSRGSQEMQNISQNIQELFGSHLVQPRRVPTTGSLPKYLLFVQKQFKNTCDSAWHWIHLPRKKGSAGKYKVSVLASPLGPRAPTSLLSALSHQLKYFSFLTQFLKLIFPLVLVTAVEFTFVLCIFSFPKQPWKLFSLNCWHFTLHRLGVLWLKVVFGVVYKDFECTASTGEEDLCADTASGQEFLSEMLVLCREWLLTPKKMWNPLCSWWGATHSNSSRNCTETGEQIFTFCTRDWNAQTCKCSGKIWPFRVLFMMKLQADLQPQLKHWASVRNPFLSSSVRLQEVQLLILEIVWAPWLWRCH